MAKDEEKGPWNDDEEQGPWSDKDTATATATAEPPTDEEIEASYGEDVSPKIRAALQSGVAPMQRPTQFERGGNPESVSEWAHRRKIEQGSKSTSGKIIDFVNPFSGLNDVHEGLGAIGESARRKSEDLQQQDLAAQARGENPHLAPIAHPQGLLDRITNAAEKYRTPGAAADLVSKAADVASGLATPKNVALGAATVAAPQVMLPYFMGEGAVTAYDPAKKLAKGIAAGQNASEILSPEEAQQGLMGLSEFAGGAAGAGELVKHAGGVVPAIKSGPIAGRIAAGLTEDPAAAAAREHKLAVPPTKGDVDYDENFNRSAPHLAEEARKAPITTVREAEAASNKAITKIDGQVRTALGQIPEETVNGNSILDSARKAVDAVKRTPEERAAATKLLEGLGIRGDIGILDADQLRERLNAELSGEYDKTGSDRATLRKTNSSYAANEAAANALRDAIYDRMEARGITEARELRRDQGALMNMRDHYHDNIVKSEAADAKPQPNTPLQKAAKTGGQALGAVAGGGLGTVLGPGGTVGGAFAGREIGGALGEKFGSKLAQDNRPNARIARTFENLKNSPVQPRQLGAVRPVPTPAPQGPFQMQDLAPNRGALWQQQVGELPPLETGAPTPGRHLEPIGPQPAAEKPLGPITGEQLPLGLPGAHHDLFNLPQTPKVGERSYAPEGVKGMLPPPSATELPPPGTAELAHPRMFPQEAGSAPAEPQVFRQPKGKPGAGRMAKGFTSEPVERTVGQTAEGGPIGEAEAAKIREKIDAGREKVGGKGREGLIQPINKTGAADLKVGDTFVDEKGDPRRITDIGEDGKIKTADHTLRDYESGEIKHLGEINSPKAQLARGGMFHPSEEVPEEVGEVKKKGEEEDRYDLGEIGGAGEKVKPMTKPGEEVKGPEEEKTMGEDEKKKFLNLVEQAYGDIRGAGERWDNLDNAGRQKEFEDVQAKVDRPRSGAEKAVSTEEAIRKLQENQKGNERTYEIKKPGEIKPEDLSDATFLLDDGSALKGGKGIVSHMDLARGAGQHLLNDANAVRIAAADSFELHGTPSEAQLAEMRRLHREVAPQDRQTVHSHNVYWDFYPQIDPTQMRGYSADAMHIAHDTGEGSFSDFRRAMDDYYQPAKVEPEKINAQGRAIFSKPPESEALEAGREKVPAESEDTFKPDDVRVSTRVPSSVNAEDAHTKPMEINMEAIKDKDLPQRLVDTVKNYPGMKEAFKDVDMKDPNAVLAKFVEHVSNNLEWLHNQMPEEVRKITRQWYDSAHQIATENAEKFGHTMQQASGVLAVLSPQKDWFMNKSLAERVQDIHANQQDTVFTPEMKAKAKQLAVTETKNVVNKTIKRLLKDYEDDLPDDVLDKAKDFAKKGQRAAAFEVLRDATGLDEEALPVPKQRIGTMAKKIEGKTLGELDSKGKAAWIRIYDEAHNPREFNEFAPDGTDLGTVKSEKTGKNKKVAWGGLNSIEKAVNILEDGSRENISRQLGEEHKVRNFYNNIADPNSEHPDVTIDTHAVAAGHISPFSGKSHEVTMNFSGPGSDITGSSGTYALNAEAYRQAAARLGIKPRELQSIVWEQIRDLFPAKFKTAANMKAVANIWKDYGKGNISLDEARNQVVQKAGGFKTPDWLEKLKNAKK